MLVSKYCKRGLALPLLVLHVFTNNINAPAAAHHLAILAYFFDRRLDLHRYKLFITA